MLADLGYLSIGSQMRGIYEQLQVAGDRTYELSGLPFRSSWFGIYYLLSKSERALSVSEITEAISYTRITVKNVVRELKSEGLVEIHKNPSDSRSKLISLTSKGRDLLPQLEELWNVFDQQLEELFQQKDFLNSLKRVNERLQGESFDKKVLREYFNFSIRPARNEEFSQIGALMVEVYSALKGFPKPAEQPAYYDLLRNVGKLTENETIELLIAVSEQGKIGGAVVFFKDMKDYGSGGTATGELHSSGFRLLAVDPNLRGLGIGKMLTAECIQKARDNQSRQVIIHTTKAMKTAWNMYENMGFKRSGDLDFMQGKLPVFGFRLLLQ